MTPLPTCLPGFFSAFVRLFLASSLLAAGLCRAQIEGGRDAAGTLWLSDQGLPAGVASAPLELDQVMSLTPIPGSPGSSGQTRAPVVQSPVTHERMRSEDLATCRSIDKRYEETRVNLETIERDKASGKVLIPDSGLVTIRQNLASLERLKALCPKTGTP